MSKNEHTIIDIINPKPSTYGYNFGIKINIKIYNGYYKFIPHKNDIIKCTLNDNKFNNAKFYLPNNIDHQKERIKYIIGIQKFNEKQTHLIFGDKLWLNIYTKYFELDEIEDDIKEYDYITEIYENIKNYTDTLLELFNNNLLKYDIKLNVRQRIKLLNESKFGINVDNWKHEDIILLFNIGGFGFKTILDIADNLNLTEELKIEILIMNMFKNNNDGDMYIIYDYNMWIPKLNKFISERKLNNIINDLINKNFIIRLKNDIIYLTNMYNNELFIAESLIKLKYNETTLINSPIDINIDDIDTLKINNKDLNKEQKKSIRSIFKNNISIIYGKGGTGKTATLKGFTQIIKRHAQLFFLAPTAKATKVMEEAIDNSNYRYQTLAGFICNYKLIKPTFKNYNNNVFIIDESSMINTEIFRKFLDIIIDINPTLVLLGDDGQLPSIGPGDILNQIIKSKKIKSTQLIIQNRQKQGKLLDMLTDVYDGTKINITDYDDCCDIKLYTNLNDDNFLEHISDETLKKSTIIVPTNKLIDDNTHKIRNIVNPKDTLTEDKEYNGYIYRKHDKIIHCKNFKSENLFNGKTGTISDINTLYIEVMFYTIKDDEEKYEDKPYQYKFKEEFIKHLKPAYMITCHKSQGSQYKDIIVYLSSSKFMLNRNFLYTALSRTTEKIILIGSEEIVNYAIGRKLNRKTLLKKMILYYDKLFNNKTKYDKFLDYFLKSE